VDPALRAGRALAAAQATYQAGAFDAALGLLGTAEAGPADEFRRARADRLRGQIAFSSSRGSDAPPLLLKAARQFEPLDPRLARETYLDALAAATFAGRLALGGGMVEVAEAARAAPPPPGPPRPPDLLLDGLALLICEGYPAGAPVLRQAVSAFRGTDVSREEGLRWLWLASYAAGIVWDYDSWDVLSDRQVTLARDTGALIALPIALSMRSSVHLFAGVPERAAGALQRLSGMARACGTDWALGAEARSRALVSDGEAAENLYREAIGRFGRTRLRVDLARARLLYGEWLRRQRRRRDARDQLASAYQIFDSIGAAAFAERARIELRAAGGHARQHTIQTPDTLTAQEALIARLAGDGASNPQIAAQLFISPATVAYHLRKVFTKLGVSSRSQLAPALPARHGAAPLVAPQG